MAGSRDSSDGGHQRLSLSFPPGLTAEDYPWVWDAEKYARLWRTTPNTNSGSFDLSPLTAKAYNNFRVLTGTQSLTPCTGVWQWRLRVVGQAISAGIVCENVSLSEWLGNEYVCYKRKHREITHATVMQTAVHEEWAAWFANSGSLVSQCDESFCRELEEGVWEVALDCNTGDFVLSRVQDEIARALSSATAQQGTAAEDGSVVLDTDATEVKRQPADWLLEPPPVTCIADIFSGSQARYSCSQKFENVPVFKPLYAAAAANSDADSVSIMAVWPPMTTVKSAAKK